jgi:hypothetical protein
MNHPTAAQEAQKIQDIAAKSGVPAEEVAKIFAVMKANPIVTTEAGTVTTRVMFTEEDFARRRAERDAENAALEAKWRAKYSSRANG